LAFFCIYYKYRGNHIPVFNFSGLEVRKYRYYDTNKSSVDIDGLLKDLSEAPDGCAVLLHACAHNPTGMDPTLEQWSQISKVMLQKKMLPFFDCAYQGFASGNAPQDAAAIRMFVNDGHHLAVVQSFSKNFGLYGQRVGALSVVTGSEHEAQSVLSQLKIVIRSSYSNPPRFGAAIVTEILSDPQMTNDFIAQCGPTSLNRSVCLPIVDCRSRSVKHFETNIISTAPSMGESVWLESQVAMFNTSLIL
jgi:aspartate aminotransferase